MRNKLKKCKNLLSLLLTAVMMLWLMPALVSVASGTGIQERSSSVETLTELEQALAEQQPEITLLSNIQLPRPLTIDYSVTFLSDSAGGPYALTVNSDYRHMKITQSNIAVQFQNVILQGNGKGGGILVSADNVSLTGAWIQNCRSTGNGGGLYVDSGYMVHLTGGVISGNSAPISGCSGGGIYIADSASITVNGTQILNNHASRNGGGIAGGASSTITFKDGLIDYNEAANRGGGIYTAGESELYIMVGTVRNNKTTANDGCGGGVYGDTGSKIRITGGQIVNNSAAYGGGVYGQDFHISKAEITENSASFGGGIMVGNDGKLLLNNGKIRRNKAVANIGLGYEGTGGGIYLKESVKSASIYSSVIEGNSAAGSGGGIYSGKSNALTITAGTISANTALEGGGVYTEGALSLSGDLQIFNNQAHGNGGGIYAVSLADVNIPGGSVQFGGNSASRAYIVSEADRLRYAKNFDPASVTSPFDHCLNNFDIAYTGGNPAFFVTFNSGGGSSVPHQAIASGDKIKRPTDPVLSGSSFLGWFQDESCTIPWNFDTDAVTRNIMLYAKWESAHSAYYTITFNANGGSSVDSQSITSGDKVTMPTAPTKSGYLFAGWYTDSALTKIYDFNTAVTSSFTLYAKWTQTHEPYIAGYKDGTFKPNNPITRAEVAQLLYNISGTTEVGVSKFNDVLSEAWYHKAVTYLTGKGIISGYPDGSFKPNSNITRAEFVTLAAKYNAMSPASGNYFRDVEADHWAIGYITAAYNAKWITGYEDGTFRPDSAITRAEAVSILNAMLGREIDKNSLSGLKMPFTDVSAAHWAYYQILEAGVKR